jgi:Protein of unknown function (DUF3572)
MDSSNRKHGGPMAAEDAMGIALNALVWIVSDEARADRLLELTGLSPDDLRNGLGQPAMLANLLGYLTQYEPDLIAFAEDGGIDPASISAAYVALGGQHWEG